MEWTPPPGGIAMCHGTERYRPSEGGGIAFDSRTIGLCQITEELLATVAGGHIGDTDSILDDPPDLRQHMAPHQMAMPVVY